MMMLNERKYAESILEGEDLGKNTLSTLRCVIKYCGAQNMKKSEIKSKVVELLKNRDPLTLEKCEPNLNKLINSALERELIEIDYIPVTATEMDKIASATSLPLRKLLFTLLCAAKYRNITHKTDDDIVTLSDAEIFNMANVSASKTKHGLMLNDLKNAGLVEFRKAVNSTSIHILFIDRSSEPQYKITDMRALGYRYASMVNAAKYVPCATCGLLMPWHGSMIAYCKDHDPDLKGNKVTICPDCGEVHVQPTKAKTNRCPRCYEIYRRKCIRDNVDRLKIDSKT